MEGCETGRKTAEIAGQATVDAYIKNLCATDGGKETCPNMCGVCKYLILIN